MDGGETRKETVVQEVQRNGGKSKSTLSMIHAVGSVTHFMSFVNFHMSRTLKATKQLSI